MNRTRKLRYGALLLALICHRPGFAQDGWTLETTLLVKGVGSPVVSPDGRLAAYVVSEPNVSGDTSAWRSTLHVVSLEQGAGAPPIFRLPEAGTPVWAPDSRWLAFTMTRGGDRNVWRVPAAGGEPEPLTTLDRSVGQFRFSPDGTMLAFMARDGFSKEERRARSEKPAVVAVGENPRFTRLWVVRVGAPDQPRLLTPAAYQVGGHIGAGLDGPAFTWSPDGKQIAFTHSPSPGADDWVNADVSLVDVATGETRVVAASKGAEGGVSWSPDGMWIAMAVTEEPASYALTTRIHIISPKTGQVRMLAESFDRRPSLAGWSADSRSVYIVEGRGVGNRFSALPVDGSAMIDLSPDTLIVGGATLAADNKTVGFTVESPAQPPEAYVARLPGFKLRRISAHQPLDLPPAPRTEIVRWTSFDGRAIEGLLTHPINAPAGTRAPLLVIVHGGPPMNYTNGFTGRLAIYPINVFAQRGFAVLRPNVRGSAGYGRDFRYANVRDWGGGDTRDVLAGVDALVARGIVDSARVGLMGWSYGGYLAATTITRTPRFRAASVGAGITDLISYSGTADIPGFVPSYYQSEFWEDIAAYQKGSAIYNVGNVSTPTLIQHGELDERVPIGQGYQLYNALKRRGVPVRMLVYPRQGHGIGEPRLQMEAARANLEWFEKWVLAD